MYEHSPTQCPDYGPSIVEFIYYKFKTTKIGDVDCNGKIELADIVFLCKFLADLINLTPEGKINADCDVVPGIGSGDIVSILNKL